MFDFHEQEMLDLVKNRKEILARLALRFEENIDSSNELFLKLRLTKENYSRTIEILKSEFGFNAFLGLWGLDEGEIEDEFILQLLLLNMDTHQRICLQLFVKEEDEIPSLTDLWSGAFWSEQETWDMYGLQFKDIPKERLFSPEGIKGFPLRKNFMPSAFSLKQSESYEFEPDPRVSRLKWKERKVSYIDFLDNRSVGPIRAILECDDEVIERGKLEVGYLHRGVEKIAERLNLHQFLPHLSRINFNCTSAYEVAWCKGAEEYLDIYVPDRAKALRMVFNELDRIFEHLDTMGKIFKSLDCRPFYFETIEMKEAISSVYKFYSGKRFSHQLIKIGGISSDIPKGWITECFKLTQFLEKKTQEISRLVSNSALWMNRLCHYSLNSDQAVDWGVTGPNLRASGVNYDLRKVSPYYFYEDIDFEIPLGINGQCYDRYLVRVEEIFQSLGIIDQLLDNLPLGECFSRDPSVFTPTKSEVYRESEALIQHHKIYGAGILLPKGAFYSSVESPNGELGFHVTGNNSGIPSRVKMRTPSFFSGQCFSDVIEGGRIEEIPLVLSSLNLSVGEIDR